MSQRADLLYDHRKHQSPADGDGHLGGRIADQMKRFWSKRDARLNELGKAYSAAIYGTGRIEPLRGTKRPVVVLTMGDHRAGRYMIFPTVTKTAAVIGIMDCSLCEAIRKQRLARGHVVRYLDQIEHLGRLQGGRFVLVDAAAMTLSTRERLRLDEALLPLANVDAQAN